MDVIIFLIYSIWAIAGVCGVDFVFADSKADKSLSLKIAKATKISFKEVFQIINEPSYFSKIVSLFFLGGALYHCWLYLTYKYLLAVPLIMVLTHILADRFLFKLNSGENYASQVVMRLLDKISKLKSTNPNADVSKMATISDYLIDAYELDKSKPQRANEEFKSSEYMKSDDELEGFDKSKFLFKRAMREIFGGLKSLIFLLVIIMIGASAKYWFK